MIKLHSLNKHNILGFCFFINLLHTNLYSQNLIAHENNLKLLYLIEGKKIFEEDLNIILNNLTYANSNNLILNSTVSINSFYSTKANEINLNTIKAKLKGTNNTDLQNVFANDEKENDKFINVISDCNRFLHINIAQFNGGFEVKLELFVLRKNQRLEHIVSQRAFINPINNDYYGILKSAIKKVFIDSHAAPKITSLNTNCIKINSIIYASMFDTIIITPNISVFDIQKEDIKFYWSKSTNSNFDGFEEASNQQILDNFLPGKYQLSLIVSDGISKSNPFSVELNIEYKPSISRIINQKFVGIIVRNTLFGNNYALYSRPISFTLSYDKSENNDSIKLFYELRNPKERKLISSSVFIKGDSLDIIPSYSLISYPSINQAIINSNTTIGFSSSNSNAINYYPPLSYDSLNKKTTIIPQTKKNLLLGGTYTLSLATNKSNRYSDTTNVEFDILEQKATGFYVNYLIFPLRKIGLMNAGLCYGLGFNFNFMQNLSVNTALGVSVHSKIPQKFFGEIGFNIYDFSKRKEGGYVLMIYDSPSSDQKQAALGIRYLYLIPNVFGDFKLGGGAYYTFNRYYRNLSNWVVGLNYIGTINWNKRTKSTD